MSLAAVSLLLCLGSIALWIRSYKTSDWIEWVYRRHFYAASTARGAIALTYSYVTNADKPHFAFESVQWPDMNAVYQSQYRRTVWNAMGFRYDNSVRNIYREADGSESSGGKYQIQLPLYVLVFLFALAPLVYIVRFWRRRRRRGEGLCPVCGYDLRASPDRCPECGRAKSHGGAVAG